MSSAQKLKTQNGRRLIKGLLVLSFKFWVLSFELPCRVLADMPHAMTALEERRWSAAMEQLIEVLEKDPKNAEAKAYVTLVARQMENEARSSTREKRLAYLSDTAQRLDENRQDSSSIQNALVHTTQAESRAREEHWRLLCEEARMKREGGQLLAANDLILQVIAENPSYGEAQRELSELQSALRSALDSGRISSIPERYTLEGFYAYGQSDYDGALTAWKKARAILEPGVSAADLTARLAPLRFAPYERIAQQRADDQNRLARLRRLFEQGIEQYRKSQFALALDTFRQVAIKDPEYPLLGHYLVQSEAGAETERAARLGEARRKDLQDALEKGTAALFEEKYSQAVRLFEKALSLDPSHAQARSYLATARSEMERSHDPKAAQARYESGLVAYASGKLEDAAREWRTTLKLNSEHEKARIALAKVQKELAMSRNLP